jgi:hypothetical protein|tara:strand:- start:175 stop:396 length:222 start_codon:yes stop_codon:yes gene_type:complete
MNLLKSGALGIVPAILSRSQSARDLVRDTSVPGMLNNLSEQDEQKSMKKGGKVSASSRADGCCVKGKTKGRML